MTNDVAYQLAHREETRVPSLILSGAICLAAAYMAVVLRLISRRLVRSPLAADDWCMVLGLVSNCRDAGHGQQRISNDRSDR